MAGNTLPRGEGVAALAVTGEERRQAGNGMKPDSKVKVVSFLPAFLIRQPFGLPPSPRGKVLRF